MKVYIASAYTIGDTNSNVRKHLEVSDKLIKSGFIPFAPLLFTFQDLLFPQDYETWMKIDFEWIRVCDCLLRLEGESVGADREVACAKENNIPVFYKIEDVIEFAKNDSPNYGIKIHKSQNKTQAILAMIEQPTCKYSGSEQEYENPFFGNGLDTIFPLTTKIKCGCEKTYNDLTEFPDDTDFCKHGNKFVEYYE